MWPQPARSIHPRVCTDAEDAAMVSAAMVVTCLLSMCEAPDSACSAEEETSEDGGWGSGQEVGT